MQKKKTQKKKLTPKELEELYDSGDYRLNQERNDFLLPQILDFVRQKRWMNIRPEYQRRLVWDRKKKSLFIESLLMNIPIPPIFLYETDLNRYEVMDGQQRLNAVLEFYENDFKLTGLERWSDLNGYSYNLCPPRIQRGLDRRRLSATVLLAESPSTNGKADLIRREVFERLNTGGQSLNSQELRNSLYSGRFNDLIIELAGFRTFDEIWGIPPYEDHYRKEDGFISQELAANKRFKRMEDCELVLRFFALRRTSKIKGSMRNILDTCMMEHADLSEAEASKMAVLFKECTDTSHQIFGDKTFQIRTPQGDWRHSVPLYDAVMIAVERLRDSWGNVIKERTKVSKALQQAFKIPESYEIIVGKPNTAEAVKSRITLVYDLLEKFA